MRWKLPVMGGVFGLVFALNPAFVSGCGSLGSGFHFGEQEVVALLESESLTSPHRFRVGDADYVLTVELTQRRGEDKTAQASGAVRDAHACSGRTFLRSANACLDTTEMPIEGRVKLIKDGAAPVADVRAEGSLRIHGTRLDNADLTLEGDGHRFFLSSADGRSFEVRTVNLPSSGSVPFFQRKYDR